MTASSDSPEGLEGSPEAGDPQALTAAERRLLTDLGARIVRAHLTTPVLLILESGAPLHFLASQAMVAMSPMLWMVGFDRPWRSLAETLEKREAVPALIAAIEAAEESPEGR